MGRAGAKARIGVRALRGVAAAAGGLALLAVSGCASEPDLADILVTTTPPGAACVLTRGGAEIAHVSSTPGIARFGRADADVTIVCHRHGFKAATEVVHPQPVDSGIFGGGSSYGYEDQARLPLVPLQEPNP
jgi:hypothetical protein